MATEGSITFWDIFWSAPMAIRQLSTRSRSIPRNPPTMLKKLPPAQQPLIGRLSADLRQL